MGEKRVTVEADEVESISRDVSTRSSVLFLRWSAVVAAHLGS